MKAKKELRKEPIIKIIHVKNIIKNLVKDLQIETYNNGIDCLIDMFKGKKIPQKDSE